MGKSKMRSNIEGVMKIYQAAKDSEKMRVQVGIFGNKDSRSAGNKEEGMTNSELGFKHEFGYTITEGPAAGITVPSRSFLRMPIATHIGEIIARIRADVIPMLSKGNVKGIFKRLGISCEITIAEAFQTSGWGYWMENTPFTVKMKGFDKPLIDTTQLERSITSRVAEK